MKNCIFKKIFLSVLSSAFFLSSCSDNTVPSPEMEKITDSDSGTRSLLCAPSNAEVSQGARRQITLKWDSVSKAKRYFIYAADSLFSDYKQVGESTKNTFTYSPLSSGSTKYLKICSVDSSDNCSYFTNPLVGTTLAQPIISDISGLSGSEDSSLTVYWYMENAEYYEDELEYTISCKDSDGKEIANCNVYASELDGTYFTLDDLTPNESYVYTVSAFLSSAPTEIEISDEVDAETARRLRPNPPEELTASEGNSTSEITLSFKLPSKVDVLVASKTYSQYALYFKIYRRASEDSDWSLIVPHLYYDGNTTAPASFDAYEEGREISWTDSSANLQRGVKYEYKVQSYADETTRIITSDLSSVTTTGWLAAIPEFSAKTTLAKNEEETAYESATFSFSSEWESFGTEENWSFILTTYFSEEFGGSATGSTKNFDSLSDLNDYTLSVDLTDSANEGYYNFSLAIVSKADESEVLLTAESSDTFFLTAEINQPKLDSFSVTDGYSSKNLLSWDYEAEVAYELVRKTLDCDGNVEADSTKTISGELSSGRAGEAFSYTDSDEIESGKIYSYTLYATKNERKYPSSAILAKTLGNPSPFFESDSLAYDSITVSWDKVQMAEEYELSLWNGESQLGDAKSLKSEEIEGLTSANVITYTISEPEGFNDARISGKALSLKITAKNSLDSCEEIISVRTLGPATASLSATQATDSGKITLTWNEIDGAEGYILQRVRYDIPEDGSEKAQRTDVFYVDSEKTITYGETEIGSSVISLSTVDGKITLNDIQNEALSTNDGFESSQALISSGLPFEYTVLPVLSSDDVSEVSDFTIQYKNLDEITQRGSTKGFGHNVKATKAIYATEIEISWSKPAFPNELVPVLYRRKLAASKNDIDSSAWEKIETVLTESTTKYTDTLSVTEANIYEYAVKYGSASFSKAYLNLLSSRTTALNEAENLGYAFNIYYKASTGPESDFAEQFDWLPFDSSYRKAAKVTGYEIYLNNTNYPNGWQKIATLDENGVRTAGDDFTGDYDFNTTYSYTTKNPYSLTLKPRTASAKYGDVTGGGSYEGLLKVLRDPRHYYKIVMSGAYTEDGSTFSPISFDPSSEEIDDDMTVYACRQITDAELARSALCVMAYGFFIDAGGKTDLSNADSKLGYEGDKTLTTTNGGIAIFESRSLISALIWDSEVGKYKANVSMTNYAPEQLTPSGYSSTMLKISMSNVSTRTKGLSDPYLDKFRTEDFSVSVSSADSNLPLDYSAELTMTCTGSENLTIKKDGTTIINTTSSDVRRYYFPIQIDDNHCWLKSSDYGWWEE